MKKSVFLPNEKHEGILAFGCGCNKSKAATAAVTTTNRRITIYQVIDSSQAVVGEFASLAEARAKAVSVSGRVKVTSKQITV